MKHTEINAAVCRAFGAPLTIERLRLAPPAENQVQIAVKACAICHSDITYLDGGWGGAVPFIAGHEVSGVISAAGAGSGYRAGERVVAALIKSCGGCRTCRARAAALCENPPAAAAPLQDAKKNAVPPALNVGGFAEQIVVHKSQVARIPPALPYDEAALLPCGVLTGWGAVTNTAKLPPGAAAAVVGCGGVGLNIVQSAAIAGAKTLCALDLHDSKLHSAMSLGATHAVNLSAPDYAARLRQINGGKFEYVFMAATAARAVEFAAALLAPLGALVLAGMQANGDQPRLDTTTIANAQQRILGSKMGGADIEKDIPTLARLHQEKRLQLKTLIGGHYPLADINAALTAAKSGSTLKSVIIF